MAVHHPCLWVPCALPGGQDPLPLSLLLPAMHWGRRTFPRALKAGKLEVKLLLHLTFTIEIIIKSNSNIELAGGAELGSVMRQADGLL